jgi:hypothetical protein
MSKMASRSKLTTFSGIKGESALPSEVVRGANFLYSWPRSRRTVIT